MPEIPIEDVKENKPVVYPSEQPLTPDEETEMIKKRLREEIIKNRVLTERWNRRIREPWVNLRFSRFDVNSLCDPQRESLNNELRSLGLDPV